MNVNLLRNLVLIVFLLMISSSSMSFSESPVISDLSVCRDPGAVIRGNTTVDVKDFVRRLHGTWVLSTRSIQGVAIDAKARFYFDMDSATDTQAGGSALCLDRGNLSALDPLELCPACLANAAVGAHWKVTVSKNENPEGLLLSMAGEYLGSYGDFRKGITATESAMFYNRDGIYIAGDLTSPAGGQGMPDDVWDLISLTEDTLTYISCRGKYIDQYVKLSSGEPRVDGASLAQAWEKRKNDGSLLNPLPVWEQERQ